MLLSLSLTVLLLLLLPAAAVWTDFDLVRPWFGWGSTWNVPYTKISSTSGNGPQVATGANFGRSVASIGDLNGDGVEDLVVGADGEESNYGGVRYVQTGAVYILFMNSAAHVSSHVRISKLVNGGPDLSINDNFGCSVANAGDLDGDGIDEIAVGAPGLYLSAVYLLYMFRNGTVRKTVKIQGPFIGNIPPGSNITIVPSGGNGPPIQYQSNFGSALAALGDFDGDGVPDLLVGASYASSGASKVYALYMTPNGTVRGYDYISGGQNGAPTLSNSFAAFGSSIVAIGDMDGDNVTEIAVGAKYLDVAVTTNFHAGHVFVLFLTKNFTVKSYGIINELPIKGKGVGLPLENNDNCGSGLAYIGDINQDNMRQHHPKKVNILRPRPSLSDVIIGCPQTLDVNQRGTGKMFLAFLNARGYAEDYREVPRDYDIRHHIAPALQYQDQFGTSLAGYVDVDQNGIREIAVGAPGDQEAGAGSGAIYIIFLRRRKYHPPFVDHWAYILSIALPTGICCLCCMAGVAYFFWYFRRKPDEVEIAVKAAKVEITKTRKRKKQEFGKDGKVYADEYVA